MNRLFDDYQNIYGSRDLMGFMQGLSERHRNQRSWSLMFDEIDLFLMPTSLQPPFENDLDFKQPALLGDITAAQAPLFAITFLGLPSVAIPCGTAGKLPVGVQLVGPMHDDDFALDIAETLEKEIGGFPTP